VCSYDQLVLDHRVDPVEVLTNLGFVQHSTSDVRRLPDQFLLYQSRAKGITCDDYLNEYPDVRQHLEQKLAIENAFRIVNRTPPSPVPIPVENASEGQLMDSVDHSKLKSWDFTVCSVDFEGNDDKCSRVKECVEGYLKSDDLNLYDLFDSCSAEINGSLNSEAEYFGESVDSEDYFQGHSASFQGHPGRGDPLKFVMLIVSALFADDRLPMRYLVSLMRRLRSGRDADQAALVFDGYGLDWSWKLDSESPSSVWLPSTDLDSLNFMEDSIATDDWSMQPPTAGYWLADPTIAADWSRQLTAARDWPIQPCLIDKDYMWDTANFSGSCSVLPAFRRPLSGLLSTTSGCFTEFPDQSHYIMDRQNLDSPDHCCRPKDDHNLGDFDRSREIFCDCCGRLVEHLSSPVTKSWDEPETVDFFIDDGTEAMAGYRPQVDVQSRLRKSANRLCNNNNFHVTERDVWNDLLFTRGDLIETLV